MKTKRLCYVILFCAVLFLSNLTGCRQQHSSLAVNETKDLHHIGGCTETNELQKTWAMIDKKSIRQIVLLRGPEISTANEPIEIPQECLEGYVELLDKAIGQVKCNNISQNNPIKIVTDTSVYLIPGDWMINGKCIDIETHRELQYYLFGCEVWNPKFGNPYDTSGWTKCHSPREIWLAIKKENIRKIIFCCSASASISKADEWPVIFEVPQKCLKGTIKLLDKAMNEPKKIYRMAYPWQGFTGMKLITDKEKYLIPAEWPHSKLSKNKMINGSDWASSELLDYLRKCGFDDPNQPLQKRSE